jgi:hypothetical protein
MTASSYGQNQLMSWVRFHFRLALGICLVSFGGLVFVVWAGLLYPLTIEQFAMLGYGAITGLDNEKALHEHREFRHRLFGWSHDDHVWMGLIGDKNDVAKIIAESPEGDLSRCLSDHRHSALCMITNHDPGNTRADWVAWWEKHQHMTQSEWMKSGFQKHGLAFSEPLTREQVLQCLKLIGQSSQSSSSSALPRHVIENLKRLLLHESLDTADITPQEVSADPSGATLAGFIAYSEWRAQPMVKHDPFEKKPFSMNTGKLLFSMRPHAPWVFMGTSLLAVFAGSWLIATRNRKRPQSAATAAG